MIEDCLTVRLLSLAEQITGEKEMLLFIAEIGSSCFVSFLKKKRMWMSGTGAKFYPGVSVTGRCVLPIFIFVQNNYCPCIGSLCVLQQKI